MSISIRAEDREHFALVRESLASDGLHLAMVTHDRRRLQDYAAALAGALARDEGLRVEAYSPSRLEALIVDLTLHRFDAALSRISGTGRPHRAEQRPAPGRPGCVLFIPDAQQLPRAEFLQLIRLAAGTRGNGLRLVALFNPGHAADCDERIAAMGAQLARWDLDDQAESVGHFRSDRRMGDESGNHSGDRRGKVGGKLGADHRADPDADPHADPHANRSRPAPGFARRRAGRPGKPTSAAAIATTIAASAFAAVMLMAALLPGLSSMLPSGFPQLPSLQAVAVEAPVVTRSGRVELAGEPRQDYSAAGRQAADGPSAPPKAGGADVLDAAPMPPTEPVPPAATVDGHDKRSALFSVTEGATR